MNDQAEIDQLLKLIEVERARAKDLEHQLNNALQVKMGMSTVIREYKKEKERAQKILKALDFYARHHHHLNTTSPNFARMAIDEYGQGKK